MRTLSITITADDPDDTSWGTVADAIENSMPVDRSLPLGSEWSGDFSRMAYGVRIAMSVRDGDALDPATGDLDTLDALMEALDDVRTVYTRLRLQEGVLADAVKAGDDDQAEFSRGRIGRHTVELARAQERLDDANTAHKAAHP